MKKLEKKLALNRLTLLDLDDLTRTSAADSRSCPTICSPPVRDYTTCFGG